MALDDDIEVLSRVPLFAGLPPDTVRLVAFSGENRDYTDGGVLFREGDTAESAFVVTAGQVDLLRERIRGRTVLASVGPGTLIGELALVVSTTRPCKAMAVGRTRCVIIRRPTFRRVLDEYPEFALALRQKIALQLGGLAPAIGAVAERFDALDRPSADSPAIAAVLGATLEHALGDMLSGVVPSKADKAAGGDGTPPV